MWHAQVLPVVRAVQLNDLLTGEEKEPDKEIMIIIDEKSVKQRNPAYMTWMAWDQAFLGYLFSSLTHETLMHVSCSISLAQAWCMLANFYASQSRAHAINTQIALATTKKLHLLVIDYYAKMCQYDDDLAATGAPLHDDELVAYILAGLDEYYNSVFTPVCPEPNQYLQVSSIHNFIALSKMFPYKRTRLCVAPLLLWLLLAVAAPPMTVAMVVLIRVTVVHAVMVAQVMVAHPMGAHHIHSARCALNLGTQPTIVGIVLKKTMSRSNGLWLLHLLQALI
jgi:hypothetical protein